jgi:hypothetical protein
VNRQPPILRADYRRQIYGTIALYLSLFVLGAIILGVVP